MNIDDILESGDLNEAPKPKAKKFNVPANLNRGAPLGDKTKLDNKTDYQDVRSSKARMSAGGAAGRKTQRDKQRHEQDLQAAIDAGKERAAAAKATLASNAKKDPDAEASKLRQDALKRSEQDAETKTNTAPSDVNKRFLFPFVKQQVSQGKRTDDKTDQGADKQDVINFTKERVPNVDVAAASQLLNKSAEQYPFDDGKKGMETPSAGVTRDTLSATTLDPIDTGDDNTGGPSTPTGGGRKGYRVGRGVTQDQTYAQDGETQKRGEMNDREAAYIFDKLKKLERSDIKWLLARLKEKFQNKNQVLSENTRAEAEYRIRRISNKKGIDAEEALRQWRRLGSPTETADIANLMRQMGGKKVGMLKKGMMKIGDMWSNASSDAKALFNFAKSRGVEQQIIDMIEKSSLQKNKFGKMVSAMRAESVEYDTVDEARRPIDKEKMARAGAANATKNKVSDKAIRDYFEKISAEYGVSDEQTQQESVSNLVSEASKVRMVKRLLKEYSDKKLVESSDLVYVVESSDFNSLLNFLGHAGIDLVESGFSVHVEGNSVKVSEVKKKLAESKVDQYLDTPISVESLKKIISIIDSNNVGGSLNTIRDSIISKLGDGKVANKTLKSIGDELISLSRKGLDLGDL